MSVPVQTHGFYRGLSAPLLTCALSNALYFGTYFNAAALLRAEDRVARSAAFSSPFGSAMVAGTAAAAADLAIAVPVEAVKTAMQVCLLSAWSLTLSFSHILKMLILLSYILNLFKHAVYPINY